MVICSVKIFKFSLILREYAQILETYMPSKGQGKISVINFRNNYKKFIYCGFPPNVNVKWVVLLPCIQDIPGLNLSPETVILRPPCGFPQSLQMTEVSQIMTQPLLFRSSSIHYSLILL